MSADTTNNINFKVIKDTYIGVLKEYPVFNGRARRREFWIFFFVNLVLGLIPFIGQLVSLLTCIPSIAVGVRRLHDTNRSGFWYFLGAIIFLVLLVLVAVMSFGGIFGGIFGFYGFYFSGGYKIFLALMVIISLVALAYGIILLVWAVQEGTRGSNKYGPDPKRGAVRRTASGARKR